MVDDNAYRVILTSSATLPNESRATIANHMIEVAKFQRVAVDEDGKSVEIAPVLLEARAKLAAVIGEGVASSEQYIQRKNTRIFKVGDNDGSAQSQADKLARRVTTSEVKKIDG
jgi:hypothetical protein